jgi:hypothetical protein
LSKDELIVTSNISEGSCILTGAKSNILNATQGAEKCTENYYCDDPSKKEKRENPTNSFTYGSFSWVIRCLHATCNSPAMNGMEYLCGLSHRCGFPFPGLSPKIFCTPEQ